MQTPILYDNHQYIPLYWPRMIYKAEERTIVNTDLDSVLEQINKELEEDIRRNAQNDEEKDKKQKDEDNYNKSSYPSQKK